MQKTQYPVEDLVKMIERGQLRLPELQRKYVWPATRVRDLLDSLYRGYPSGQILVWQTTLEVPEREMAVRQTSSGLGGHYLLLDGQQRLTSLAAVVSGQPLQFKNRVRPVEMAFNLEHPEGPPSDLTEIEEDSAQTVEAINEEGNGSDELDGEGAVAGPNVQERIRSRTFVVGSRSVFADPRWVRVSDIFNRNKRDRDLIRPLGITPDDPAYDQYTERLQRVRKIGQYVYDIHILGEELSYEEVAEIFVRVNSLGMKLRGSDLALAQITARWPNSLDLFEEFGEECERYWFNFDVGLFVRAMVVFATKQSRFKTVGRIPVPTLQEAWEKTKVGLRFAVNFLRQNAGIENESLLSSPMFVIPIAVYAVLRDMKIPTDEQRDLLHWLLVANAMGHYSGSSETTLDSDVASLFRGGSPKDLMGMVEQQFGRIRFSERDFEQHSTRHPLFATTFLALRDAGATDWGTGLRISLTHQGKYHYIEAHHIFPKAVLSQSSYEKSEINEIANFAFVGGAKNRMLGARRPDAYLPSVLQARGREALAAQGIPLTNSLWAVQSYREFLRVRRQRLAEMVNAFLDKVANEGKTEIDPDAIIAGGEGESVEFKETARFNTHTGREDKALEQAVVKTVAAFLNSKGGTLFIGVNDAGIPVGIEPDLRTFSARQNTDGYEQFLRQLLVNALGVAQSAGVEIRFPDVDGKSVCMLRVPAAGVPVYARNGDGQAYFVRVGNTTRSLSIEEAHRYIQQRFS